jgi:SagB-type dehydrogenase family enzyme
MTESSQPPELRYLLATRLDRGWQEERPSSGRQGAAPLKNYANAARVPLPGEMFKGDRDWNQLLQARRSRRRFGPGLLSRQELAALLWGAQGVTSGKGTLPRRAAPSAGALYPLETYVVIEKVEELPRGLYHFDVREFHLDWLSADPHGRAVAHAALEQSFLAEAAAIFLWSAVFRRTTGKYGSRGLRYILLEAGHACQNLLLAAEALGLAACPVAAFYDDELNDLLVLDGEEEAVLYLAAVGRKG